MTSCSTADIVGLGGLGLGVLLLIALYAWDYLTDGRIPSWSIVLVLVAAALVIGGPLAAALLQSQNC